MKKQINKTVDLSNYYSGVDQVWWTHNDDMPSTYNMASFFVSKGSWKEWKEANISRVLSHTYAVKSSLPEKLIPRKIISTIKSSTGYDAIVGWKETESTPTILEIEQFEVWWNIESRFDIQSFYEGIKSIRSSSNEKASVYMVVQNRGGLDLQSFDISVPQLDIKMNYGDEWAEKHEYLIEALNISKKKGIALLHGLPGTGKSMYIRHLISLLSEKRTMIYLPNQLIDSITDPAFIPLMSEYPNAILIIEDGDEAIKARNAGGRTVDKILNLSDGILSDFLGTQIICTFNSDITTIDDALLRKGRLILKHKFDKLPKDQAQRLSNHLGFESEISIDMTLAEIYNQNDKFTEKKPEKKKLGF